MYAQLTGSHQAVAAQAPQGDSKPSGPFPGCRRAPVRVSLPTLPLDQAGGQIQGSSHPKAPKLRGSARGFHLWDGSTALMDASHAHAKQHPSKHLSSPSCFPGRLREELWLPAPSNLGEMALFPCAVCAVPAWGAVLAAVATSPEERLELPCAGQGCWSHSRPTAGPSPAPQPWRRHHGENVLKEGGNGTKTERCEEKNERNDPAENDWRRRRGGGAAGTGAKTPLPFPGSPAPLPDHSTRRKSFISQNPNLTSSFPGSPEGTPWEEQRPGHPRHGAAQHLEIIES